MGQNARTCAQTRGLMRGCTRTYLNTLARAHGREQKLSFLPWLQIPTHSFSPDEDPPSSGYSAGPRRRDPGPCLQELIRWRSLRKVQGQADQRGTIQGPLSGQRAQVWLANQDTTTGQIGLVLGLNLWEKNNRPRGE